MHKGRYRPTRLALQSIPAATHHWHVVAHHSHKHAERLCSNPYEPQSCKAPPEREGVSVVEQPTLLLVARGAACAPLPRTISARLFSVKSSESQKAMSLYTGGYFEKLLNLVLRSPSLNCSRKRLSPDQNSLQAQVGVSTFVHVSGWQEHAEPCCREKLGKGCMHAQQLADLIRCRPPPADACRRQTLAKHRCR